MLHLSVAFHVQLRQQLDPRKLQDAAHMFSAPGVGRCLHLHLSDARRHLSSCCTSAEAGGCLFYSLK
jgi:hypothetical protein